jgi:elongation factor 1-gamma
LIQQFLSFLEMHVRPSLTPLIGWRLNKLACDLEVENKSALEMKRWLDYYEGQLKNRKWLASNESGPSLADIVTLDVFNFGFMAYIDAEMRKEYPSIVAWYERVRAVPELEGLYGGDMVEKRKQPSTD